MDDSKVIDDPSIDDSFSGIAVRSEEFGTVDFKIIDKNLINNTSIFTYSGPIYGDNPNYKPFKKKEVQSELKDYLEGIPDEFNFQPILLNFNE